VSQREKAREYLALLSPIGDNKLMKNVKVHDRAREDIRSFPKAVKKDIGELLFKLQFGVLLGMPESRPMPTCTLVRMS
jgi:hypothetical protein